MKLLALLLSTTAVSDAVAPPKQPNVITMLTDDQVGFYPIVTSRYRSTTLESYARFSIIFSSCFSKVAIG
jgi:hypothetical protein